MFTHGSQERFCYCPGGLLEVSGFYHTSTNLTPEENTFICRIVGRAGKTASLDNVEKINDIAPAQHSKIRLTMAYSLLNQSLNILGSGARNFNHTA
jgi:hypothetical protein